MSETSQAEVKAPEKPRELVHFLNCDVVINNDSELASYGHELANLFREGRIPENWQDIGPTEEDYEKLDEDMLPPGTPKPGMAVGEVRGKKFLAKQKPYTGTDFYAEQKAMDKSDMNYVRHVTGVKHEMSLSPIIKRLIASEEMQDFATSIGYSGIRFVEPVVAVVNRKSGKKYLVYEYIENAKNLYKHLEDIDDLDAHYLVDKQIENFFAKHGIWAREGEAHHLMIDEQNVLNLFDIEVFEKMPTSKD